MKSAVVLCLCLIIWMAVGPFSKRKEEAERLCSVGVRRSDLRCFLREKNPARISDWDAFFALPRVVFKEEGRESGDWDRFLEKHFQKWPALLLLERAVWVGDLKEFPAEIKEFYLASGAMPVLALSGQHVWGLVLLLGVGLQIALLLGRIFRRRLSWRVPFWSGFLLPIVASLILYFTSQGNASMLRTTALFISVAFIRSLGIYVEKRRVLFLSVVVALFLWPEMLASPGYVLSFIAVGVIFLLGRNFLSQWVYSLLVATIMPLAMAPWTVFYFAKFSFSSLVMAFLCGVVWEMFWIPVGFVLPLLVNFPLVLGHLSDFFLWFLRQHTLLSALVLSSYRVVPVVNNAELFLLSFSLVCAASMCFDFFSRTAKETRGTHCNSST